MKYPVLLKKIVFSSWFLAAIPAILIIIFLPRIGSKYNLRVEETEKSDGQLIYADMNSDTVSETIYVGKGLPYYFITVRDINQKYHDQWNFTDSLDPYLSEFFTGNYDHDRFREIYAFTYKKDSLFINISEVLEPSGLKMERVFVTKIGYINGTVTSALKPAGFYDENGDGKDELYFTIATGFGLQPRKVYYFDIVNKTIKESQLAGSVILGPRMKDADGDNRPEIFGTMSASGNYKKIIPFPDSSTWFMVYDDQLRFKFPPVEFPGFANGLDINSFSNGNSKGYVLSHLRNGADTAMLAPSIMLFSTTGELLKKHFYSDLGLEGNEILLILKHNQSDKIYVVSNKIIEFNDQLEPIRTVDLPFRTKVFAYQFDINADGEDELLLHSFYEGRLQIYNAGLQKYTDMKFKTASTIWRFSHYYSSAHDHKVFLRAGTDGYMLRFSKNNFYYLGYLAYPGVYFLLFFFILLIRLINTYQVAQKESLNRRLISLQLQGIKAQLDPHFTFNTLNSVSSLIYLDDRQAAYDYMNKFTQLLRGMINDAERIYRTVNEELDFVKIYLDLEKLRFGEKLNYSIEIGDGITGKEQVPKLVLHTFAENAVKHGIMRRDSGGKLLIKVEREKDYLRLTIEDNGIGRSNSAGFSNSTGKGLKITGEFYSILNQINKRPIHHKITDLYDDFRNPSGTRVEVRVPVDETEDKGE
jgi:two-component sensor histidine kinase